MCCASALQDGELQQGMTADHLFPILQSETDSESLSRVASTLATGCVAGEVLQGLRLGQITVLKKPDGGAHKRREGEQGDPHANVVRPGTTSSFGSSAKEPA